MRSCQPAVVRSVTLLTNWASSLAFWRRDALYRRVATSARWSLGGAIISRGLTLVSLVVVARALEPGDFGKLTVIQTTAALAAALAGLGLGLAATKRIAEQRNEDKTSAGQAAGAALVLTAAAGALLSVTFLVLSGPISRVFLNAPDLSSQMRLAALLPLVGSFAGAQLGILYGLEAFREVFLSGVARGIAVSVLLVIGAYQAGLTGALVGLSGGELLAIGMSHIMIRRSAARAGVVIPYRATLADARTLYRLAGAASIASIAIQSAMWFGQLVLVRQADGFSQAALFNLAYRWYLAITFLSSALSPIALPLLANVRTSRPMGEYGRLARLTLIGSLAVVVGPVIVVVGLAPAIMRLGGPAFASAWPTLVILAAAALPSALNNALSQTALSLNKVRAWLLSDGLLAVTLAVMAFLLVPYLGGAGLAIAYLSAMVMTCIVLVGPVRRGLSQVA
jgi:O-antigen/teichoic acid export membrane protein